MPEPVIRRQFRCAHVLPVEGTPAWQVLLDGATGPEVVGGRAMPLSGLTVTLDDPMQARAFQPGGLYELAITPLERPAR